MGEVGGRGVYSLTSRRLPGRTCSLLVLELVYGGFRLTIAMSSYNIFESTFMKVNVPNEVDEDFHISGLGGEKAKAAESKICWRFNAR